MKSKFKHWKCRTSQLGKITTNKRVRINRAELAEIEVILKRERDSITNAKVKPLTMTLKKRLKVLLEKRDGEDVLPEGAKTFLNKEYNRLRFKRFALLHDKKMDKGTISESDSLQIMSDILGDHFYEKNAMQYSNPFLTGEPDNTQEMINEVKSNWEKETFDKAEMIHGYKWQVKGYVWMLEKTLKNKNGRLHYCLSNTPAHIITNELNQLYYKLGMPTDEEEYWIEAKKQLERNHIFNAKDFKEAYPNWDFNNKLYNEKGEYVYPDIPLPLRHKYFDVKLEHGDRIFIMNRVRLCRKYLMEKERIDNEIIAKFESK